MGPHGAPHGPPMGPHGVPWGPLDPILWLDPIPVRAIHRLHGYERGNVAMWQRGNVAPLSPQPDPKAPVASFLKLKVPLATI